MIQSNSEPNIRSKHLEELETIVTSKLAGHVSQFQLIESVEGLRLRGSCKSFFAKQMAQELLMQIGNFHVLVNELEVGYFDNRIIDRDPERVCRIGTVFYPSGFADSGEVAFMHALKITIANQGLLWMLNVENSSLQDSEDHQFPGIRKTLERWGTIPVDSPKSEVARLGFDVQKVTANSQDPVSKCIEFLSFYSVDLVVLTLRQRDSMVSWSEKTIGLPISRVPGQPTLFIPKDVDGFVSKADGSIRLKNILIPINRKPCPRESLEFAKRLVDSLQQPNGTVTLLHVGSLDTLPLVEPPEVAGWNWVVQTLPGNPADTILQQAEQLDVDLIVMTTDGPDRFIDKFFGTTSERVLRKSKCPILVLPIDRMTTGEIDIVGATSDAS
ncbi:MAG: universal stress protein [Pirellulaceae bacterium]|nr:universal stress protein [Pirellulaceae bacterium]